MKHTTQAHTHTHTCIHGYLLPPTTKFNANTHFTIANTTTINKSVLKRELNRTWNNNNNGNRRTNC